MLYLASGPLLNAANSRVVPTEFAAEPFNIDICYSSQVLNSTSVKLNRFAKQAKLFKKTLFFKSDGGHAISRQEKWYSAPPVELSWESPPPPQESVRAGGQAQPNFLASIGYQICLAMVLRWRTMRAGFAISDKVLSTRTKLRLSIGDSDSL